MAESESTRKADQSTVIVDAYRTDKTATLNAGNQYKGLFSNALAGLHAFVGEKSRGYLKEQGRVLDLAAGRGAMSLRLSDMGYQVNATDYVGESFQLHGQVPFITSNLNERFADQYDERYDGIVGLEIIEHLENPRHFARECFKLLNPGGRIILTTPNVDSPSSIASFITTRKFQWFSDAEYRVDGHITPLTQWQLLKVFEEAGFKLCWTGSFGDHRRGLHGSPRLLVLAALVRMLSRQPPGLDGEIFVGIFERPA